MPLVSFAHHLRSYPSERAYNTVPILRRRLRGRQHQPDPGRRLPARLRHHDRSAQAGETAKYKKICDKLCYVGGGWHCTPTLVMPNEILEASGLDFWSSIGSDSTNVQTRSLRCQITLTRHPVAVAEWELFINGRSLRPHRRL